MAAGTLWTNQTLGTVSVQSPAFHPAGPQPTVTCTALASVAGNVYLDVQQQNGALGWDEVLSLTLLASGLIATQGIFSFGWLDKAGQSAQGKPLRINARADAAPVVTITYVD
jgi:hypothetical protein